MNAKRIQRALSAWLFIAFRTDLIYVCRQNCQWNQKGLLDVYRMRDGVAWSQSSAQRLILGTGLNVRQRYLSGKPQLPDPKIALPGGYFVPFTERERGDFQDTGILIYTLGFFCLKFSFLRRVAESKKYLFISMHLTPILRLSLTLATAHAMILLCRIGSSDLPLSWTSWDIHFAFLEMNCVFAMCVFRGPDALFMRWSRAERVWYSLFTFQWE